MLKILNIIGARPQIIKAAAVSRAIAHEFSGKINDIVLHTGQHYDKNMSGVFFEELNIPEPKYNLGINKGTHASQTAGMMKGIENIIQHENPDAVILYGDTNSTLAGSLAASKLHCPVIHIEAGLRSGNKLMPEEINRIVCDHSSTLLFVPTKTAYLNLQREGFILNSPPPFTINNPGTFICGDIMYDNSLYFSGISANKYNIIKKFKLESNNYLLVTVHRDNNTDIPERIEGIFRAIHLITSSNKVKCIIPLHPRTSKILKDNLSAALYKSIINSEFIKIISPVSFLEMIELEKNASVIMTDSGGMQKESFFFKKPCLILRDETEWLELVENGNAIICGSETERIVDNFNFISSKTGFTWPEFYGSGNASQLICENILKYIAHG